MSIEEALGYIEKLKNDIMHTNSERKKVMCMISIIAIIEYLSDSHGFLVDIDKFDSSLFRKSIELLDREAYAEERDFLNINDLTNNLANGCINIYNQQHFNPFIYTKETKIKTKVLKELLNDFFGTMGDNVYKKYLELSQSSIGNPGDKGAGVCWDFFAINKQSIDLEDSSPIDFTIGFVHELGHAVHLDAVNQIGKKKLNGVSLGEGVSLLFELLYMNYLSENNIDVNHNLRFYFINLLGYALKAKAGALAKNREELIESEGFIYYPDSYLSPKEIGNYAYIFEEVDELNEYVRPLYYFYGSLVALKFIYNYGMDYHTNIKEILKLMYKNELMGIKKLLEEIELDKVPDSLVKNLRRIR